MQLKKKQTKTQTQSIAKQSKFKIPIPNPKLESISNRNFLRIEHFYRNRLSDSIFEWITWRESGPLFVHNTYVEPSKLGNVFFIGKLLRITMEGSIWHTYKFPATGVIVFRVWNLNVIVIEHSNCLLPPIDVLKRIYECCPLKKY